MWSTLEFWNTKTEILFKVAMNEGSQSYRAAKASDNIPKRKTMLDSSDVHLSFKLQLYFQIIGDFFLLLLHFISRLCAGSFAEKSADCACNSFHA